MNKLIIALFILVSIFGFSFSTVRADGWPDSNTGTGGN